MLRFRSAVFDLTGGLLASRDKELQGSMQVGRTVCKDVLGTRGYI
jgi:hypothetical protein